MAAFHYLCFEADLVQVSSFLEAWHSGLDQKQTDAVRWTLGLRIRHGNDDSDVRMDSVRDKDFTSVEYPVITVPLSVRADALNVTGNAQLNTQLSTHILIM